MTTKTQTPYIPTPDAPIFRPVKPERVVITDARLRKVERILKLSDAACDFYRFSYDKCYGDQRTFHWYSLDTIAEEIGYNRDHLRVRVIPKLEEVGMILREIRYVKARTKHDILYDYKSEWSRKYHLKVMCYHVQMDLDAVLAHNNLVLPESAQAGMQKTDMDARKMATEEQKARVNARQKARVDVTEVRQKARVNARRNLSKGIYPNDESSISDEHPGSHTSRAASVLDNPELEAPPMEPTATDEGQRPRSQPRYDDFWANKGGRPELTADLLPLTEALAPLQPGPLKETDIARLRAIREHKHFTLDRFKEAVRRVLDSTTRPDHPIAYLVRTFENLCAEIQNQPSAPQSMPSEVVEAMTDPEVLRSLGYTDDEIALAQRQAKEAMRFASDPDVTRTDGDDRTSHDAPRASYATH